MQSCDDGKRKTLDQCGRYLRAIERRANRNVRRLYNVTRGGWGKKAQAELVTRIEEWRQRIA